MGDSGQRTAMHLGEVSGAGREKTDRLRHKSPDWRRIMSELAGV
jgi:hypothetical protein